jgi:proliferating cell nuclear antigen
MLQAKMNDGKILKGVIEATSAIIDETYLEADEKGIKLTALDPSHICMLSIDLPKELFAEYTAPEAKEKIGVNLEDLAKIMKRAGASDAIVFEHHKESEKFLIKMKNVGMRTFSTRLVEIDAEKIPPSAELDIQFTANVTLDSSLFDSAIKDCEIYQDTMEVTMNKEAGVKFSAEGEVGDIEYQLDKDHLDAVDIKTELADKDGKLHPVSPAHGIFSLSFLKNIMKASAIADKVTLSLAENAPMRFEFAIGEGKGKITYILAPRVSEEDSGTQYE